MVQALIVNVDTATPEGIQQAKTIGLADSNSTDLIISSYVLSAASLFTPTHCGRAFTIFRHPVDVASSLFVQRRGFQAGLKGMALADYVAQDWYPDNWMVRQLTAALPGEELTLDHLQRAKNMLSAKFVVGIVEQMDESMRQFRYFFGWRELPGKEGCARDLQQEKMVPNRRQKPSTGTDDWMTIVNKERWDMDLYIYALEMFARQAMLVRD